MSETDRCCECGSLDPCPVHDRPTLARVPRYKITIYDEANNAEAESVMIEAAAYDALAAQLQELKEEIASVEEQWKAKWEPAKHSLGAAWKAQHDALAAQLARVEMERDGMVAPEELAQLKYEREVLAEQLQEMTAERDRLQQHVKELERDIELLGGRVAGASEA